TFASGWVRYLFVDSSDPNRCSALLNEGQWLDDKYTNWQPQGCMLNNYQPAQVKTCLSSKRVVFAGDSVTRQLFFAFAHIADPSLPQQVPHSDQKHSDHHLVAKKSDLALDFYWDPYLNGTLVRSLVDGRSQKTALLVLGSGLWYLRYSTESGGLAAWESMIDTTFAGIEKNMPSLADKVIYLPVEHPISSKLSAERAAFIHDADVDAMNSDLLHRVSSVPTVPFLDLAPVLLPSSPIALPFTFNKMLTASQTNDGLHFSDKILKTQANILLNYRCNDVLPKKFPMDKTCCRSYPYPSFLQGLVILIVVGYGPLAYYMKPKLAARPKLAALAASPEISWAISIFGGALALMFFADRMPMWMKEQKQFDTYTFAGVCLLSIAAGLGTVTKADKDMGFLNRDQTDEWKGWMQIAILIYHYYGASKISGIYNPIRVLVASYLWMTGYGHFTFYYKKADFGFLRIAQVMVRLNLLTVALAYVMNTDYVFYYFAPLVSLWFLVIYGTMVAGSKYNGNLGFMVTKLLMSMGVMTYVFKSGWIIEALFAGLARFCNIQWSAREWMFRVTLDMWIVYVGMFCALAYIKIKERKLTDSGIWPTLYHGSIFLSVLSLIWYFWFELSQPNKFAYNGYHPYISFIPVLAFIVLRNATPTLRKSTSRVFAFIGQCSLETFIMQYHFWLAGDTKGILMVLPFGTRWRALNLIVSTIMFIYLSHEVADATGYMTNWICGAARKRPAATLPPPVTAPTRENGSASNGGVPESIPLIAQSAPTPPNGGTPAREIIFDVNRLAPVSPQGSSKDIPSAAETSLSVESSQQHNSHWLNRLLEAPLSPVPQWNASRATRNRIFSAWTDASSSGVGLGVKTGLILASLWLLNIMWPST
ncbi:hypothetical protein FRC02_008598, partial [Tulasnella sp. 418]